MAKINSTQLKYKMRQINRHFEKIEEILNSLPQGLQEEIQEFHNSDATLQYCTRWGLQASEELYKDAKKVLKKAKENYDI